MASQTSPRLQTQALRAQLDDREQGRCPLDSRPPFRLALEARPHLRPSPPDQRRHPVPFERRRS